MICSIERGTRLVLLLRSCRSVAGLVEKLVDLKNVVTSGTDVEACERRRCGANGQSFCEKMAGIIFY